MPRYKEAPSDVIANPEAAKIAEARALIEADERARVEEFKAIIEAGSRKTRCGLRAMVILTGGRNENGVEIYTLPTEPTAPKANTGKES